MKLRAFAEHVILAWLAFLFAICVLGAIGWVIGL